MDNEKRLLRKEICLTVYNLVKLFQNNSETARAIANGAARKYKLRD